MRARDSGFTLIELMIVVVIIGILAAIAVPNFIAMQGRAKEGATKSNMHTFQVTAEDYGIQNDSQYAPDAARVVAVMPGGGGSFRNPFTSLTGSGVAWEDRATFAGDPSPVPGIVSYSDSSGGTYNVKGRGKSTALTLILTSGQ